MSRSLARFLQKVLYNDRTGYFVQSDVVKSLPQPINFPALKGENDYFRLLSRIYEERDDSWLTPVEIFKPWYASTMARFITKDDPSSLSILEVGAGKGTLADGMLNFLRCNKPSLYARTDYTIVEISKSLAEHQRRLLAPHRNCRVVNEDFLNESDFGVKSPTWVIAVEVFDNLPHDKIVSHHGEFFEMHVSDSENGGKEVMEPLHSSDILEAMRVFGIDKLIEKERCRSAVSKMLKALIRDSAFWVPTLANRFLHKTRGCYPTSGLIIADYSKLLDTLSGLNGPTVQSRREGRTDNHYDILAPAVLQGKADVLFPTDFISLNDAVGVVYGRTGTIFTHRQFVSSFADSATEIAATRTASGYNPFVQDFTNQSIFTLPPTS